jgi:hypothetical protein
MMAFVRSVAVVYLLATYVLALVFSGLGSPGHGILLTVAVAGLVFYVIGTIVLQMTQHKEGRSILSLVVLIGYPFLSFFLQFGSAEYMSREFWRYAGWTNFVMIEGGFMLGIVLSPLIARGRGMQDSQISSIVRKGREHIANYGWKGLGGAGALVVLLLAPAVLGVWLAVEQAEALKAGQGMTYGAYIFAGILAMAAFTYERTKFGLQEKRWGGNTNDGSRQ